MPTLNPKVKQNHREKALRKLKTNSSFLAQLQQRKHKNSGDVPTNLPPAPIAPPEITGTGDVDSFLSVSDGVWNSSEPVTYSYEWQLNGIAIIGAVTNTLLCLLAWVGSVVRCIVKATNQFGFTLAVAVGVTIRL